MCGIVGIFRPESVGVEDELLVARMLGTDRKSVV